MRPLWTERMTAADVPAAVDQLLTAAAAERVSDLHLVPRQEGLSIGWRRDGLLEKVADLPNEVKSNFVARLKVLADLLTYQTELPQEGRIRNRLPGMEVRVSTFPTLFGEKAVVRLFASGGSLQSLNDLGLPDDVAAGLSAHLEARGGVMLITGPAGSGKTTTAYACLRKIVARSGRSIATVEDPIESVIDGTAQSQVKPAAGFSYEAALRSLLRQDPDVIFVGEIRDAVTAQLVFQAALTGHLVLTTFHAGSVAEALSRLQEMNVEPYQLRTGIRFLLNLRLLRQLCHCSKLPHPTEKSSSAATPAERPAVCEECRGTGYLGRFPLCEFASGELVQRVSRASATQSPGEWERAARHQGMQTRWDVARNLLQRGRTDAEEVRRVLGFEGELSRGVDDGTPAIESPCSSQP